jgi:hypothetical protein
VSDDSEREYARMADEARREADEAAGQAKAEAERTAAEADRIVAESQSGEARDETLRQLGVMYGGLIGIAVVMIQPFMGSATLDLPAKISSIAFAVSVPLLAALILVNRQEMFRGQRSPSVMVTVTQAVAEGAAFVGIVAGFWHIDWVAGVVVLASGSVAVGVHSAGWYRLEASRQSAS